jgi:hypothetical protein
MAEPDNVVETLYGKEHKFQIARRSTTFRGIVFDIYRDGKYWHGDIGSLADAVKRVKKEG